MAGETNPVPSLRGSKAPNPIEAPEPPQLTPPAKPGARLAKPVRFTCTKPGCSGTVYFVEYAPGMRSAAFYPHKCEECGAAYGLLVKHVRPVVRKRRWRGGG